LWLASWGRVGSEGPTRARGQDMVTNMGRGTPRGGGGRKGNQGALMEGVLTEVKQARGLGTHHEVTLEGVHRGVDEILNEDCGTNELTTILTTSCSPQVRIGQDLNHLNLGFEEHPRT